MVDFIETKEFDNARKLELVGMYIDNFHDDGMSGEALIHKLTDIFDGKLDDFDISFLNGEEDNY